MRIRLAATALVALGAAAACALGTTVIVQDRVEDARESQLRSSAWSVQASTDFGTTWTAPISTYGGHFPVRVDTSGLRDRSAYQPLTLRTSADSRADAEVAIGEGVLVEGDPTAAAQVRVRQVGGTVAAGDRAVVFTGCTELELRVDLRTNYRLNAAAGWRRPETPAALATATLVRP